MKQSYGLENVRVLSYRRLQNLMVLALCAMYFTCVYLGDRARVRILAHRALTAGRRLFGIPDFRYYALADGIKRLLEALRRPFIAPLVSDPSMLQPNLFDP